LRAVYKSGLPYVDRALSGSLSCKSERETIRRRRTSQHFSKPLVGTRPVRILAARRRALWQYRQRNQIPNRLRTRAPPFWHSDLAVDHVGFHRDELLDVSKDVLLHGVTAINVRAQLAKTLFDGRLTWDCSQRRSGLSNLLDGRRRKVRLGLRDVVVQNQKCPSRINARASPSGGFS
jgi:hypothetical protein